MPRVRALQSVRWTSHGTHTDTMSTHMPENMSLVTRYAYTHVYTPAYCMPTYVQTHISIDMLVHMPIQMLTQIRYKCVCKRQFTCPYIYARVGTRRPGRRQLCNEEEHVSQHMPIHMLRCMYVHIIMHPSVRASIHMCIHLSIRTEQHSYPSWDIDRPWGAYTSG